MNFLFYFFWCRKWYNLHIQPFVAIQKPPFTKNYALLLIYSVSFQLVAFSYPSLDKWVLSVGVHEHILLLLSWNHTECHYTDFKIFFYYFIYMHNSHYSSQKLNCSWRTIHLFVNNYDVKRRKIGWLLAFDSHVHNENKWM